MRDDCFKLTLPEMQQCHDNNKTKGWRELLYSIAKSATVKMGIPNFVLKEDDWT